MLSEQNFTTSALVLSRAEPNDIPALTRIYNDSIPLGYVTADTEPLSDEAFQEKIYSQHSSSYPLLVAKKDGEAVGWIGLKPFYGRCAYKTTAEVSIYISAKLRGKGIGKYLLRTICEQSPEMGFETLTGFIFKDNTPSIRLFEQSGFQVWGTLPEVAQIKGVRKDLVIVGRKLLLEKKF